MLAGGGGRFSYSPGGQRQAGFCLEDIGTKLEGVPTLSRGEGWWPETPSYFLVLVRKKGTSLRVFFTCHRHMKLITWNRTLWYFTGIRGERGILHNSGFPSHSQGGIPWSQDYFCVYPLLIAKQKVVLRLPPEGEPDLPDSRPVPTFSVPPAFPFFFPTPSWSWHEGRPLLHPLAPPVTPKKGAVGELAGHSGRHLVNSSAWRPGWQLGGGFLYCSSERRCLILI